MVSVGCLVGILGGGLEGGLEVNWDVVSGCGRVGNLGGVWRVVWEWFLRGIWWVRWAWSGGWYGGGLGCGFYMCSGG